MSNGLAFKRTILKVEVISDSEWYFDTLHDVAHAITEGDCSGMVTVRRIVPLSALQTATALQAQGTDPSFLLGADWEDRSTDEPGIVGTFVRQAWTQPADVLADLDTVSFDATDLVLSMPLSWNMKVRSKSKSRKQSASILEYWMFVKSPTQY